MSNRDKWTELLPIIQAFVDGKKIQRKDYSGRWQDTTTLTSLLHGQFRVKPQNIVQGIWTVEFVESEPGSISGPTKHGTMTWEGTNMDTPPWKWSTWCKKIDNTEKFTPIEVEQSL